MSKTSKEKPEESLTLKRRRVQKYCSNTCRSKAYHARNTKPSEIVVEKVSLPTTQSSSNEKMNLAGIGNAATGTLLADGIKTLFIKEENKPVTKGDFKKLLEALEHRFLPIKNLPPNHIGKTPFYDILNNTLVYLSNADSTYR